MSAAVCMFLFGGIVAVLAPSLLRRLTRPGIAPRLGATAWVVTSVSVAGSWAASAVLLLADLARSWDRPDSLIGSCIATVRTLVTGDGIPSQAGSAVLGSVATLMATIVSVRLAKTLLRMRSRTGDHADAVRLIGRRVNGVDAVVIDSDERAAYCLPGKPGAVVVTTGAMRVLDRPQLDAILAHEHAHLNGRHPQIVALMRALAKAFPRITLMRTGAGEVARLLEMCADDAAARRCGSQPLLGGFLALLASPAPPAGALAAAHLDVIARAQRLAAVPRSASRIGVSAALSAVIFVAGTGVVAVPLFVTAGAMMCGPFAG